MVTKKPFGTTKDGLPATAYTITSGRGVSVTVLDYGAALRSVVLPHKGGRVDIVLGYDSVEAYERNDGFLGASIGRFAGRIPDSLLRVGNEVFPVTANDGKNHLHSGKACFGKRFWHADVHTRNTVQFDIVSPCGEEGYPGNVVFRAIYRLAGRELTVTYAGRSDAVTAWNPTNHAYWNLNGHDAGDARSHTLEIPADRYVPVGPDLIPTGGEADVAGTRFDFRRPREIGGEYDHSFVLSGSPIRLWGNRGIGMEVRTTCKAVQVYNAKFLSERNGKGGAQYGPFGAVCLETEGRQTLRNAPVAEENVLAPDLHFYMRTTRFKFLYEEN